MVRTVLIQSGLPASFWEFAAEFAVYTYNRTPTRTLSGQAPYEVWHGKNPKVSGLRVFGCLGYVRVPAQGRGKLDARAEEGIMVGYYTTSPAYKILVGNVIRESREVSFVEDAFPCRANRDLTPIPLFGDSYPEETFLNYV